MSSEDNYRQYEVWHDESKKNGYYHGILLTPIDKKQELINLLRKIRGEHGYKNRDNIKFAGSLKKTKSGKFIRNNLSLFSHIIKTNPRNNTQLFNRTGKDVYEKNFESFLKITGSFGCRFGLLKVKNLENTLDYFSNYRKKVETTFNFTIKACCHGMFNEDNPIKIEKFYFDGSEQYKGDLDQSRITKGNWRSYCKVDNNLPIDDRVMKQRDDETKLMMNFVDNIVGAWRALLNQEDDSNNILFPLSPLYKRSRKRKIFANKNSEWFKSISLSEFSLENGNVAFPDIFRNPIQSTFLD